MMKFSGVMPALVTPLDANEKINVPVLNKLLNDLLAKGADGFYLCGATGEGIAVKTEERMLLAEEAIKIVGGRKPCIVQVASGNFEDAIRLAKHAEQVGAAAISATPPMFFSLSGRLSIRLIHKPLLRYATSRSLLRITS